MATKAPDRITAATTDTDERPRRTRTGSQDPAAREYLRRRFTQGELDLTN